LKIQVYVLEDKDFSYMYEPRKDSLFPEQPSSKVLLCLLMLHSRYQFYFC